MALKSYKPTTPGQRGLVLIDRSELWKGRPVKSLTEGLTKSGGRNNTGRITSRRRGGGAKRLYRVVDFKRNKFDVSATVERIEYDPNRTAFIALIKYDDGEQAYILAPQRLAVGDKVVAATKADIKPGNAMPFSGMPIGTIIHNIELKAGKGGQIARAAGTYAQALGGVNLYSASATNEMYIDDVEYINDFYPGPLGVADLDAVGFSAYPNPVKNVLNLQANEEISTAVVYNVLGQEVYNANINALNATIDMASFASGAYFITVNVGGVEGVIKVLK